MRETRIAVTCLLVAALTLVAPGAGASDAPAAGPEPRVLAISIDALNPAALRILGPEGAPSLHRLLSEGAATLNARTQFESTETLPNHTSMLTGRSVSGSDGHGVTWNHHRPGSTVHRAAGHHVSSVFSVASEAGSTAMFAGKQKFSIFGRSWGGDIDRVVIREGNDLALMRSARSDLINADRAFTFVHFAHADVVGHARTFMSPAYLAAVEKVDSLVGKLLRAIETQPALATTTVILTADHGGSGSIRHDDPRSAANFRVPFVVWGPGVTAGNLYDLNPAYADPGRLRVSYSGPQPVRNGDLANLALDVLGLPPVPGSRFAGVVGARWMATPAMTSTTPSTSSSDGT